MIHQNALVIFRKVKRNKRPPLVSSTFMPHIRESKNTLKLSINSLYPFLLIPIFSITSFAQAPETTPKVNSGVAEDLKESAGKSSSSISSPELEDSKTKPSRLETDLQLDQKIEASAGQERLKLIFDDFKRSATYFVEEAKDYKDQQKQQFDRGYKSNTQMIEERHKSPIDSASDIEHQQRQESIKRFKAFINDHPPHPQYTPDSLYRLGMLLLEDQDADYVRRVNEYNSRMAKENSDSEVDIPFPQRDHRKVTAIFTKLINEWPTYRELDAALYARGYSYFEMGEEQLALRDFKAIVSRFPNSDYITEVWNLIGELYFDFAELPEAIQAYKEVIRNKESKYYAGACYKLAWTYYRNDQFEEAVESFKDLISYSDNEVLEGRSGFELRDEAIQYLAISLNEDDWDDDGITDMGAGFKRVKRYLSGEEAYQAELLDKLVEIFFDNTKYEESILTAQHLFKTHPSYRRNPEIHSKLITAYERIAQPEKAFEERDQFTNAYVINGSWYVSNYRDQDALDNARNLMKDSLLQAGTYHHERAQSFRSRASESDEADAIALMKEARTSYYKAALSYQRYLERYRKDKNTYELLYLYADALYYSEEYQRAFNQYIVVRDSKLGSNHLEESAFSAILSHIEILKSAVSKGELAAKPSLLEEERSTIADDGNTADEDNTSNKPQRVKAEEIPALVQQAIQIREDYLKLNLNQEDDPHRSSVLLYKIGEIYMDYLDYVPARERFIKVIENHSKSPVAINAANLLIESYRLERDWVAMAQWAEKIAQAGLGDEMVAQAKIWKVGALFKTAKALFEKEQYKEAAQEYVTLVDQNPENEFAAAALNNGAVAFEKARMFDSAMRTYERVFNQFPNSDFSENALFRVAYNAERFYDYDRAVRTFGQLAKKYPNGENAADAAYNAARLLEQTQDYRAAAKAYQDYNRRFSEKENAAEVFFYITKCYEKLGDWRNQLKYYDLFIRKYGDDSKQKERVITALAKSVDIYKKRGGSRKVKKARLRLIKAFDSKSVAPGSYVARYPAQAAFELIERRFNAFKKLKIKGNMRQQGQIINKMKSEIAGLTEDYSKLLKYKSLDWNIAVFYRIGLLRQIFATALYDLPLPTGLTIEEEDIYTTQIEEIAIPIEDEAVQRFETAFKKAREFRISNEWTKKILVSLNKYKPAEYPTFKDEKRLETSVAKSTSGFIIPKEAQKLSEKESDKGSTKTDTQSTDSREVEVGKREPKVPTPNKVEATPLNTQDESDQKVPSSPSENEPEDTTEVEPLDEDLEEIE